LSLRSIRFRAIQVTSAPTTAFRFVNTFMAPGVPWALAGETGPGTAAAVVD
jgi:hypothetical protein